MDYFFRSAKPNAFIGIRRADLEAALTVGTLAAYATLLDQYTIREPYHIGLEDAGYAPDNTPPILVLDILSIQIDAGLNEIPRATAILAVGRDATSLQAGTSDTAASSVVHVLERYLLRQVPARVYVHMTQAEMAGVGDLGDNAPWADEWVVWLEGLTAGPTRRNTPESAHFALHLAHFTAQLSFSSSMSAQAAAGTELPAAFFPTCFPSALTNVLPGAGVTPFGQVALAVTGGQAAYTDFWGYFIPGGLPARSPLSAGLKGFLQFLAGLDAFDWANFHRADLGGAACDFAGPQRGNTGALAALARFEPAPPNFALPLVTDQTAARAGWGALTATINGLRASRAAAGDTSGITRAELIAVGGGLYRAAGYRYGMPIAFYLAGQNFGPLNPGRGFGSDLAGITFADAAASFWELLAVRYASRYQISVAPMADRCLVIPFQPALAHPWQTIYASEIESWSDDMPVPVPIRGVVLVGDRKGVTGVMAGNNPAAPGAGAATQQLDAAFDSCQPGVFEFRALPAWLADAPRLPSTYAPGTLLNPRATAQTPQTTAVLAFDAVNQLVTQTPGMIAAVGLGLAAGGLARESLPSPSEAHRSTANRLAKSLFIQERTRPRTVYVGGRLRNDIAPGSVVALELPNDRYVKAALPAARDTKMTGMVLRMTTLIDCEGEKSSTDFQIGFVRTEAEAAPGSVLYADGHPFWSTIVRGLPWCDSRQMRARLGTGSDINTSLLEFAAGVR